MKKLLLTINTLLIITILRANPIPMPSVVLSELYFDTNGEWVIELQYSNTYQDLMPIDSIWIKSNSGTSKIKRFNINGSEGIIVIRNDSLISNLIINPQTDSIKISYTLESYTQSNKPIIYGYLNASISSPRNDQSIAGVYPYFDLYCLDKSPTIGVINDTIGMCGMLKGQIFDKNDKLLKGLPINTFEMVIEKYISDVPIFISSDGSYYSNLYALNVNVKELFYRYGDNQGYFVSINPMNITMQPDSSVNINIHILDSLMVGINDINSSVESIIKLFPNPLSGLSLNYEIALPVKSSNCYIDLVNMNGQQIAKFQIRENIGQINLPSNIENGMYSILLFFNNRNYSSSHIMFSR
jgi:hypothetical protein